MFGGVNCEQSNTASAVTDDVMLEVSLEESDNYNGKKWTN